MRTCLYDEHVRLGGRIVDFAGWDLPVQFEGVVAEHLAVRNAAGLFDASHMGEVRVFGNGAKAFLQKMVTNNLDKIYPSKAIYAVMCNENGGAVDDLIVCMAGEEDYFVVINSSTRFKDVAWLKGHAPSGVTVEDVSDSYALICLQGPLSEKVMQPLTPAALNQLKGFHFTDSTVASVAARISRTGYTGEDGFELFVPWADAPKVWRALVEAGAKPCGLGARDSLRLEAGLMLYGNDLSDDITPLEAPLKWAVDLNKDFIGKEAMLSKKGRAMKGFVMERGVARHGDVVLVGGKEAGVVTSGGFSPLLKKAIGFCLVPSDAPESIEIVIHGKPAPAKLRDTRFYVRKKS